MAFDAGLIHDNGTGETVSGLSDGFVERQKIRDLTNKVKTLYRQESRSELLRETIKEAINNLEPIEVHYDDAPFPKSDRSLVLTIGDIHYGADIHVKGLLGETVNRYNSEVFNDRMEDLLSQVDWIINKEDIDDVHVFFVGDLVDGMIHQSQLTQLEYGLVESTMKLSEYLAIWLTELSAKCHVTVYSVTGNHSEIRPFNSKHREFKDENLEKIIFWYLDRRLACNDRIDIQEECDMMKYCDINGFSFLLLHGDGEKRISDIAKETVNMYGKHVDFFVCGHNHKEEEFPMGMTDSGNSVIVRTPSICGVNEYAQGKRLNSRPGAIAMVIEEGYGRRCVYPIILN